MIRQLAALALVALTAGVTAQAPQKPGALDRSRVTGGTYAADSQHTLVGWRVDHFGFNDYFGLFGDVAGTLTLDPRNLAAAKLEVTIPISPTVASAGLRDHLLRPGTDGKSPDFFGAAPVPARFVSTRVSPGVDGLSAYIDGNLTLNGVTRPVGIEARFTGAGANPRSKAESVGFEGKATIKRSDFAINYGIPMVSDEVELELSAAFEKPAGEPQPRPDPGANACRADKVQPWIGRKATPAARAAIARATGAGTIRWIYPDSAVTMDYNPARLNVHLTRRTEIVRSAKCG